MQGGRRGPGQTRPALLPTRGAHLPYISPVSPLYLPCICLCEERIATARLSHISPISLPDISPLYLRYLSPYISPASPSPGAHRHHADLLDLARAHARHPGRYLATQVDT